MINHWTLYRQANSDSTHSNISDDSSRSCMEYCDDISDVGYYESDDVVH